MKRLFDIIFSFIVLLLLSPICVLVSLAIKIDSNGPVFFIQKRVGQDRRRADRQKRCMLVNNQRCNIDRREQDLFGKPIYIYKFRTMVENAPTLGPNFTAGDDNRVTKVGKFLRKWKIDEIPQFFNVLKGDMSIVGPRPEVYNFVRYYSKEQLNVLKVKPGITDLSSIRYRNESQLLANCENIQEYYVKNIMPDKLRLNLAYLKRQSLLYDAILVFRTLKVVFFK